LNNAYSFQSKRGEYEALIVDQLKGVAESVHSVTAEVSGVRHLGAGVAFVIASPPLDAIRARLRSAFVSWLGTQDMQTWRPHITIQNKVARSKADALHRDLNASFQPWSIEFPGLGLWAYLGGPWQHMAYAPFGAGHQT
jgi:2'-5' RNA ligase